MSDLQKIIEGIDIPPDVLRIIEDADTDGSISSVKNVLQRESSSLIEKTNLTFKELCRNLDNEQSRLASMEEKRKRLQQEMLLLKAEIEKEKEHCRLDLEATSLEKEDLEVVSLDSFNETPAIEDESEMKLVFQRDAESFTKSRRNSIDENGCISMPNIRNDDM